MKYININTATLDRIITTRIQYQYKGAITDTCYWSRDNNTLQYGL